MILPRPDPTQVAASTNSFSLIDSTDPRTMRAVGIHPSTPITKTIKIKMPTSGPNRARSDSRNSMMITKSSGSCGSDSIMSVKRISRLSSPRK